MTEQEIIEPVDNMARFAQVETGWKCEHCGRENRSVNEIRHQLRCPLYGVKTDEPIELTWH